MVDNNEEVGCQGTNICSDEGIEHVNLDCEREMGESDRLRDEQVEEAYDEDDPEYNVCSESDESDSALLREFVDDCLSGDELGDGTSRDASLSIGGIHIWGGPECDPKIDIITDSDEDSEELRTPPDSDDENKPQKGLQYVAERDLREPHLQVGMEFATPREFRDLVREWAIINGHDLLWKKNEGCRINVLCVKKCGWRCYGSWDREKDKWILKIIDNPEHICPKVNSNRQATAGWLARKYIEQFKDQPNWPIEALENTIFRDFGLNMKKGKLFRVRRIAKRYIEGCQKKQYGDLWNYSHILLQKNPESYCKIKVKDKTIPEEPSVFDGIFVAYGCQLRGFKEACRPFIGVDGTFLKSCMGGVLLSATSRDANNQMYPLAIAIVTKENKATWTWFLECLLEALEVENEKKYTFISDRQKGLCETFKKILPNGHHRYCTRHIYANFYKKFKCLLLKKKVWKVATARTKSGWTDALEDLKKTCEKAYDWVLDVPKEFWTRSHFTDDSLCDLVNNNISESFNKYILEARDKPIITCLEMIRRQLMERYQRKKEMANKWTSNICPKILKELKIMVIKSRSCKAYFCGNGWYEVRDDVCSYTLNVDLRKCDCKYWDQTGIPCVHAIAALSLHNENVEQYVHDYYKKETYMKAYQGMIYPISDSRFWPETKFSRLLPPAHTVQPGRKSKKRRKGEEEAGNNSGYSKKGKLMRCSNCQEEGHNKRNCKKPHVPKQPQTTGRPKGRPPLQKKEGPSDQAKRRDVTSDFLTSPCPSISPQQRAYMPTELSEFEHSRPMKEISIAQTISKYGNGGCSTTGRGGMRSQYHLGRGGISAIGAERMMFHDYEGHGTTFSRTNGDVHSQQTQTPSQTQGRETTVSRGNMVKRGPSQRRPLNTCSYRQPWKVTGSNVVSYTTNATNLGDRSHVEAHEHRAQPNSSFLNAGANSQAHHLGQVQCNFECWGQPFWSSAMQLDERLSTSYRGVECNQHMSSGQQGANTQPQPSKASGLDILPNQAEREQGMERDGVIPTQFFHTSPQEQRKRNPTATKSSSDPKQSRVFSKCSNEHQIGSHGSN